MYSKDKSDQIPAYCFLTAQFLFKFHREKTTSYSLVHQDFLKSIDTKPILSDFSYINPGVIIMMCYGLLVYPYERWNTYIQKHPDLMDLNQEIILSAKRTNSEINNLMDLFAFAVKPKALTTRDFIRKLRHALAHSNVNIDTEKNIIVFWNIYKNNINFETSTSIDNICIFLTGLGIFFSDFSKFREIS